MRQINQGTDVLHLPTAVGVLSDHFFTKIVFFYFLIINPTSHINWLSEYFFFNSFFRTWCCGGFAAGQEGGPKENLRSAGGRFSCKARWKTSPIWWLQTTTTNLCLAIQPARCGGVFETFGKTQISSISLYQAWCERPSRVGTGCGRCTGADRSDGTEPRSSQGRALSRATPPAEPSYKGQRLVSRGTSRSPALNREQPQSQLSLLPHNLRSRK